MMNLTLKNLLSLLEENKNLVVVVALVVAVVVYNNYWSDVMALLEKGEDVVGDAVNTVSSSVSTVTNTVKESVPSVSCAGKKLPDVKETKKEEKKSDKKEDTEVKAFDGSWTEASSLYIKIQY